MKIPIPFEYMTLFSQWQRQRQTNASSKVYYVSPEVYYKNVLVNQNGTVSAMPFDTKRLGAWNFDGQVFYQKRLRREIS